MPDLGYLDTSAVMRWAEADVPNPTARNAAMGAKIDGIIASDQRLAISELTLLEFRANVAKNWRNPQPDYGEYDSSWAERSRTRVFNLLGSRRAEEIVAPPHAAEHTAMLADIAARDQHAPLGIWDTVHLVTAARWAHEEGSTVEIFTSDFDYDNYVSVYPEFKRLVTICDLSDGSD